MRENITKGEKKKASMFFLDIYVECTTTGQQNGSPNMWRKKSSS